MGLAIRRLLQVWDIERSNDRVLDIMGEVLNSCLRKGSIKKVGNFLKPPGDNQTVLVRCPVEGDPDTDRAVEMIPPEEIVADHRKTYKSEHLPVSPEFLILDSRGSLPKVDSV